jgi:hypothetical protein
MFGMSREPGCKPQVRWNSVSCFQFNRVAGYYLHSRHSNVFAVAYDTSRWRAKILQRVHCLFRVKLLPEADDDVQDDDSGDHPAFNPGLDTEAHGHSHDEHLVTSGSAISPREKVAMVDVTRVIAFAT